MAVKPWQVADYRTFEMSALYSELAAMGIKVDGESFIAYGREAETPEDLADILTPEDALPEDQDHIYLCLFELWRRLCPEKQALTIFCDELDYQIWLYDQDQLSSSETMERLLMRLLEILNENVDEGSDPQEALEQLIYHCANDVEGFLYDYLAELVDEETVSYVVDFIDGFYQFVSDPKWFDLLRARMTARTDLEEANNLVRQLIEESAVEPELQFYLEVLSFLAVSGDKELFLDIARKASVLVHLESDFRDLLAICAEFFRGLDCEIQESALAEILNKRQRNPLDDAVTSTDPDFVALTRVLKMSLVNS